MIEYRTRAKCYLELWLDEPEPPGRYDVVVRYRAPEPKPTGRNEEFHSLQIDLSQPLDDILRGFAQNTRAEIRKSINGDALRFEFIDNPSVAQLREFIDFYDEFARTKGLRVLHRAQVEAYRHSGCLLLSRVINLDRTLTWHSNLKYGDRVELLQSASYFRAANDELRKLIGRANRRLHWEELQQFRMKGFRVYDLGGWYAGSTDDQKLMINRFKKGFGGKKVLEYSVIENRSFLAKTLATVCDLWSLVSVKLGQRPARPGQASSASK